MKKGLWIAIACLLLWGIFPVAAGSVPEDLLQSDGARIFFAEVTVCHSAEEGLRVTLLPVKAVKGDVSIGEAATYREVVAVGDFRPQKGKAYLFAYFDENNPTYAFRVSSYDTQSLSLLVTEDVRDNMFGRFEKYLKNGSYTAAEQERRQRLDLPESAPSYDGALPPLDSREELRVPAMLLCVAVLVLIGMGMYVYGQTREGHK